MSTRIANGSRYDGTPRIDVENEVTILSGSKGNGSGAPKGGSTGNSSPGGGNGSPPSTPSGNGGNWPSTTGKPSGGGRGNNGPKR